MPQYQLLPKQELAPLLSFSRINPCDLSASAYLSSASSALAEAAETKLNSQDFSEKISVAFFKELFEKFDSEELEQLKFKKPVILGHSDRTPDSPTLGPFHKAIFNVQERVKDLDLTEQEPDLGEAVLIEDKVHILESWADEEAARKHVQHYEEILDQESKRTTRKRSDPPLNLHLRICHKRVHIDRQRLVDHREAALYQLVEQLNPEVLLESEAKASQSSAKWLHKIASILSGLSDSNEIINLEADFLQRIQIVCAQFIRKSLETNVTADSILDSLAYDLLSASGNILMIMNAGIDDRRLHVESYIESVINCIDSLVKLILDSPDQEKFSTFIRKIGHCVDSVSSYLSNTRADELVLTQLEFLCVKAVFSNTTIEGFDNVRNSLINLLAQIFKSYETQRYFIVNEMLLNYKRLPYHRTSARQLRLKNGVSVLFFTAFLLRLVQSFDALSVVKEVKPFSDLPKSTNPHSATNLKRITILKNVLGIFDDSIKIASQIAEHFLREITSGDANFKSIFLVFVDDIIALMPFPDWSGSVTMLESMIRIFITEFQGNKLSGQNEPFVLEVVGKVGLELFKHKQKIEILVMDANDKECISSIIKYHNMILSELRELTREAEIDQEFQYMLLKFLKSCEMLQEQATKSEGETHIFAMRSDNASQNSILEANILLNKHIDQLLSSLLCGKHAPQGQNIEDGNSTSKTYLTLVLGEHLNILYEQYFSILISALESSKVKVATKAIKLLSPLIEINTKLLLTLKVNQSISRLLTANSPLSRDAVIDLLGKYISESSILTEKYYKAICERAADNSILVRRRVIKLMKEMYLQCLDVGVRGFIALKFLQHTNDADKFVRDAARNNMREIWFTSSLSIINTCEVMAWVISSGSGSKEQTQSFLSSICCDLLNREIRKKLKSISNLALEIIIEDMDTDKQPQAILKLNLLSTLVNWDRNLITYDDFLLLQPYLLEDNPGNNEICLSILKILKFMLKDNRSISKENLTRLRDDLLKKLTKLDVLELHEAIPVIQLLSELLADKNSIANALLSCLRILRPMFTDGKTPQSKNEVFKCCKLIHLSGCIGAYCQLEAVRLNIQLGNVGLMPKETIVSLIMKYLLHFTRPVFSDSIRIASVKNIITISTYHPRIFMSETVLNILDKVFKEGSLNMKLAVVEGLNEFLVKEDKKVSNEGDEVYSSRTVKLIKGNFHGTAPQGFHEGISASIIQRYLQPILGMCLKDSSSITLIPVRFLRLVTKLGFANPKVCISTIIALEASSNKLIKKIATELHMQLFDKHESLTDRNYTEAFKLAFQFTKRSRKDKFLAEISFLRSIYKVVNRNYLSKKKLILSLSKLFTLDFSLASLQGSIDQRDSTIFLAVNLLVVNFTSLEEVCLLLYHLDRSITMDGVDLAEKITDLVESKSGTGMSMDNLQFMFLHAQSVLALIYLRQLLATSYGVDSLVMETFRPSKPDMELRHVPRSVLVIDYPLEELELGTSLAQPGAFGKVFTRLVLSMKNYTT